MPYKIIHWGTGATGSLGLRCLLERADMELVGHYVHSPDKAGQDSGALIGLAPVGVKATQDMAALLDLGADCLTYLPNGVGRSQEAAREIAAFLERGINVVTTSIGELVDPTAAKPELAAIIEDACRRGGSSFFATGVDPGFATGRLPLVCYAVAHRIDQVRLQEFADYGVYPDATTLRKMFGFGQPLDYAAPIAGEALKATWSGTVEISARALNITIDDYRTTYRTHPASRDLDTAIGRIEAGTVASVWFQLIGLSGGEEKIVLEHVNWMHIDEMPADWPPPVIYQGRPSPVSYRLVVKGEPSFDCEFQMPSGDDGLLVTALHALNAIPALCAAPPGVYDQSSLPTAAPGPLRRR